MQVLTVDYQAILKRRLKALFPGKRVRQEVSTILEGYGAEDYEREADRVRLAILKLSTDEIESIQEHTEMAKQDYRDVLAWAEYPGQSKNWSMPDGAKKQKLVNADKEEYENWLKQ